MAHASLPTSTRWDPDCAAAIDGASVEGFYRHYLAQIDGELADAVRPWLAPMRRLTWLRTITWCARWLVVSKDRDAWSAASLTPSLREHLARTVPAFFEPGFVAACRAEWLESSPLASLIE